MYNLKINYNPNREIKVVLFPQRFKRVAEESKVTPDSVVSLLSVMPERQATPNAQDAHSTLDISSEFKTVCSPHSYKRTRFGSNAAHRILCAGGALDIVDPEPGHYAFITATLPGDDDWAKWGIAEGAHNIINRLKAWLSKRVSSRHEFYVWEHQNRSALHLHYCIHVPEEGVFERIEAGFRNEWVRLLNQVGDDLGCSLWGKYADCTFEEKAALVQCKVEKVHTSVSAYMAGYLSGRNSKHSRDSYHYYYPKRWFGVSRSLSALIKEHSEELTVSGLSYQKAKELFDEINHDFEAAAVKSKIYRHTVGRGESGVHYFSPSIQELLWQELKMKTNPLRSLSNVSSIIKSVERIHRMHSEYSNGSQLYRGICSKSALESLRDGLYLTSLQRGCLRDIQVTAVERLYIALGSQSSLPLHLNQLLIEVKHCSLAYSKNYSHLEFNRHGWLCNVSDVPYAVDRIAIMREYRTMARGRETTSEPDSSSPLVGGEPNSESTQLTIV